jgi:LysM repeat protein
MHRKYSNEKQPLTFKMAFLIVIAIHLLGAGVVCSNLFSKNGPNKTVVASPISDALPLKKQHQIKKAQHKPQVVKTEQKNTPTQTKVLAISPKPDKYILAPGDNFYVVSKKLNVSFTKLAEYNNIKDVRELKVGQVIMVPTES